jgi:hypothetical protein
VLHSSNALNLFFVADGEIKSPVLVPASFFLPSLMFASKDRSEPSCIVLHLGVLLASLLIFSGKAWSLSEGGSPFRCSSWVGLDLTRKY